VIQLALLRGINVGGRNRVEMPRLRTVFESVGCREVRTYINSGNVIFEHDGARSRLRASLEQAVEAEFGFPVRLILRDADGLRALAASIPAAWREDATMRCYVMFLWDEVDDPSVLDDITVRSGIDDVVYLPGTIVWRVDRDVLTRSGMMRLTGDDLYTRMTIRNVNTVRALVGLMSPA
jgi:uncharacterized protein (DUF1697 family)